MIVLIGLISNMENKIVIDILSYLIILSFDNRHTFKINNVFSNMLILVSLLFTLWLLNLENIKNTLFLELSLSLFELL